MTGEQEISFPFIRILNYSSENKINIPLKSAQWLKDKTKTRIRELKFKVQLQLSTRLKCWNRWLIGLHYLFDAYIKVTLLMQGLLIMRCWRKASRQPRGNGESSMERETCLCVFLPWWSRPDVMHFLKMDMPTC